MINTKHSCVQSNNLTDNTAHGHKRVKVRTIDGRQFGLIAEHIVCYAWVNGHYFYRGANATAHIKRKLPNKLVQAWLD